MIDRQAYRLIAVVVAVAVLAALGVGLWALNSDLGVSIESAVIMAVGVLLTVLLAGGLMTALFLSDRTGRDQ
jgi:hypothetical protein